MENEDVTDYLLTVDDSDDEDVCLNPNPNVLLLYQLEPSEIPVLLLCCTSSNPLKSLSYCCAVPARTLSQPSSNSPLNPNPNVLLLYQL